MDSFSKSVCPISQASFVAALSRLSSSAVPALPDVLKTRIEADPQNGRDIVPGPLPLRPQLDILI
jgi:hypothetical protein